MLDRSIESSIQRYLSSHKILILVWARQVGKTTLLRKYYQQYVNDGKQAFFLNLERPQYLDLLNQDPENLFSIIGRSEEKKYVFIDEIQKMKDPSIFLKYLYDEYSQHTGSLKLIVTWSSAFYIDQKFKDSLAGRKNLLTLYSLSFTEFLVFKQRSELSQYIGTGDDIPLIVKTELEQLAQEYMVYGWYPEVALQSRYQDKEDLLKELTNSYIKKDIQDARLEYEYIYFQLMAILASQVWNLVNYHELANTLNDIDESTVKAYITIMRKSFHIWFISPFFSNKRKEISKMPKVYYYDMGIRNSMLNDFSPIPLRLVDNGWLLENFFFRLLLESKQLDEINFWRNNNKNEVDFVVWDQAREIKNNLKKFSLKKYRVFTALYPEITLQWVDLSIAIQLKI